MKRGEFEHVIRAAAAVVQDELVVIGSQAVLAEFPDAPDSLLMSMEVDLYARSHPERAIEIDGALGDGSSFHAAWAYYAHGVGPETAIAPAGWEGRLVRLELRPIRRKDSTVVAWCMSIHDLVLAKLAAGRTFAADAVREGLADPEQLRLGVELMPESHRDLTRTRLERLLARTNP